MSGNNNGSGFFKKAGNLRKSTEANPQKSSKELDIHQGSSRANYEDMVREAERNMAENEAASGSDSLKMGKPAQRGESGSYPEQREPSNNYNEGRPGYPPSEPTGAYNEPPAEQPIVSYEGQREFVSFDLQQPKKKSNGLLIAIFVLIIGLIIAGVVFMGVRYSKDKAESENNQQQADAVIAQIDELDPVKEITADSEDSIEDARAAYNRLTDKQKKLVTNLSELESAETALEKAIKIKEQEEEAKRQEEEAKQREAAALEAERKAQAEQKKQQEQNEIYRIQSNPSYLGTFEVTTSSSSLNVRSGPGESYSKIGSEAKGALVEVYGYYNGWYYVYSSSGYGWMKAQYMTRW